MIDGIETPALVVDLERMKKNIERMVRFTRECGVELRPHVKTHKVPEIARMQLDAGSRGVCLQKVSEVEVFATNGFDDIFLTNEVVAPEKIRKLALIAGEAHIGVAVDDVGVARTMGRIFKDVGSEADVYVDVDVGMHRCGVSAEGAGRLVREVSSQEGLIFRGLMGYEGNVNGARSKEDQVRLADAAMDEIVKAKSAVEKEGGMKVDVVSVGSSVSTWINAKHPAVTEVQPGMYIFNDHILVDRGVASWEDCALTVVSSVMSKPSPHRAVVDAGSKAFNFDTGLFPKALDRRGVRMTHFSEEHGWLELEGEGEELKIGDRIRFVPAHCCTTVNQFDELYGIRGDRVEKVFRVLARGKMR